MIKVFRTMSLTAIALIIVLLVLGAFPGYEVIESWQPSSILLNGIGAIGAGCAMIPWPAALWHWRRQYPPHPHWIRWGLIVFFGLVPGAWAYWIIATRHHEATTARAA